MNAASRNVRHVHQSPHDFPNSYASGGGFDYMFASYPIAPVFKLDWSTPKLVDKLFSQEKSAPDAFNLWRAAFMQILACPTGIYAALSLLTPVAARSGEAIDLQASMLERVGLYAQSRQCVLQARGLLDRKMQPDAWLESHATEAGRYYTAGDVLGLRRMRIQYAKQAARLDAEGVAFDKPLHQARSVYLDLLAFKALAQIPMIGRLLQKSFGPRLDPHDLQAAAQTRYERGQLQDLHLIRTAASDVGIIIHVGSSGVPGPQADQLLTVLDSFAHLNNLVGLSAAYRRSSLKNQKECQELLEALSSFGHYGELWKAFKSFGPHLSERHYWSYRALCSYSFRGCEYFKPLKMLSGAALRLSLLRMDWARRMSVSLRP